MAQWLTSPAALPEDLTPSYDLYGTSHMAGGARRHACRQSAIGRSALCTPEITAAVIIDKPGLSTSRLTRPTPPEHTYPVQVLREEGVTFSSVV